MEKAKSIIIAVVALLILIVILQNTESVRTNILFMTLIMPRALLLFVTLLIGVIIGVLSSYWVMRKKNKNS